MALVPVKLVKIKNSLKLAIFFKKKISIFFNIYSILPFFFKECPNGHRYVITEVNMITKYNLFLVWL